MVDSVVTKQELIDAQKDAQSLEDVINGPADTRVKPRIGPEMWTLATINSLVQQGQIKISDLSEDIQIALAAGAGSAGWTANLVADGNQTQKEINLFGGKKYDMPVGGYPLGAVVRLDNGDIVKSTAPNNTKNPNLDMVGWRNLSKLKFLTFDMYNVPKTNSSAKIQEVFNESLRLKIPVINSNGTYELDSPITIKYDHDLTGTIFKVKSSLVGSAVTITRDDTPTVDYADGSTLVNIVKTVGVWGAKNPQHIAFNAPELNNCYLIIITSMDYYRYRSEIKKRIELLKYYRNGNFQSGCYFDFDFSQVTSIKSQKIAPYVMQSNGLNFDETEATCDAILRLLDCNKVEINGLNFTDNSTSDRDGAQNKIIAVRAHEIICDHPFFDSPNKYVTSGQTSYAISLNSCYQPEFIGVRSSNVGSSASNNLCSRVTFTDCDLALIDFHEPCLEYLKVNGGCLGSGVQASVVGDLYINQVRQTYRPNGSSQPNGAIVRTRDDIGGWFCGDIYIDNHVIDGAVTTHTPLFYVGSNSTNNLIPAGSPIPSRFANNIYVDGIKVNNKHIVHAIIQANLQGTTPYLELPKLIKINNFELTDDHTNPLLIYPDHFKNVATYKEIILDNLRVGTLLVGGGDSLDMVTVKDSKKQDGSGFSLFNMSSADITIEGDTLLYQYSENNSGTFSTYTPKVRLNDARFMAFNLNGLINTSGNTFNRIKSNKLETRYLTTKGDFLKNQLNKVAIDSFIDNGATGFVVYFSSAINTVTTQVSIGQESMDFEVLYNDGKPRSAILTVRPLNGAQSVSGGVSADVTVSGGLATIAFTATNITKVLLVKNR